MKKKALLFLSLLLVAPMPTSAAPAHRQVPAHRRTVKSTKKKLAKKAPAAVKTPKPVCEKSVIRVRTGTVLRLVPKERCF